MWSRFIAATMSRPQIHFTEIKRSLKLDDHKGTAQKVPKTSQVCTHTPSSDVGGFVLVSLVFV